MISLLDTNVLIRFLTNDSHPKYKTLYAFFESLEKGEIQTELKLIVLFQTAFVLKSFYEVPRERIASSLQTLLKFKGLKIKEKRIVTRMLDRWRSENIEIVDCYLIACLKKDKQSILYSYDLDFGKYDLQRIEP